MSDRIFISYRRGGDSGFAQALFIRLEQAFSHDHLFMDVDSIAPGTDFVRYLDSQVAECDVLLALIGETWFEATDGENRRRLDDPGDFVRIEIASALRQGKRVIPVLLNDARIPSSETLPEELRPLAHRQAVRLTHERFRADTEGLIRALQGSPAALVGSPAQAAVEPPPLTSGSLPVPVRSQSPAEVWSIAGTVEAAAMRYGATNIGVISLLSAVLLIFCSYLAAVLDVKHELSQKQVGFLWAPNWSVNYLILFPVFICLFCLLVVKVDEILHHFYARGVILAKADTELTADDLLADWRSHLGEMMPIVWLLNVGVPFVVLGSWYNDCYKPLQHHNTLGNAVDWSLIAIVQPEITSHWAELAFTLAAYSYLTLASWIYLFVFAYAAMVCAYLGKLSRGAP